jgi:hypothetical protein
MLYDLIKLSKPLPKLPEYDELCSKINFWKESVEVDEDYWDVETPNGTKCLLKFPCESDKDYRFRKDISSPKGIVNGILEKYMSTAFKAAFPERSENDFYKDVDLLGSSVNDFIKDNCQDAAIQGCQHILVDTTSTDDSLSVAQKKIIGSRAFLRNIDNENVINYVDYRNHLMEIIVILEDASGKQFGMYFNTTDKARIELDKKLNVESIGDLVPHNFSSIPVVRILPFQTDESFLANACLTQRSINQKMSLENLEIYKSTYTKYFGKGLPEMRDEQGNVIPIEWGNSTLLTTSSENADIKVLGAEPGQALSIRNSYMEELKGLYLQYHLQATSMNEITAIPSGLALQVAKFDFNSICTRFVKTCETAENSLAVLLNDLDSLGLEPVKYNYSFLEETQEDALLKLRDLLAIALPQEVKDAAIREFSKKYYNIVPKIVPQTIPEVAPKV